MSEEHDDDLRATAESIARDADRLKAIEAAKLALDPDDPRVITLAEEAARIGEEVAIKTSLEKELALDASRA